MSVEKNNFCKSFVKANTDYKLIEAHKVRKKKTGSIIPKDKTLESEVRSLIKKQSLQELTKKNILINGLFLNKESRIDLIAPIREKLKIKVVAISFANKTLTDTHESNQKTKELNEISFDTLRSQFSNFKLVSTSAEADLIIDSIEQDANLLNIDSKIWEKQSNIKCDNFKKLAEYIEHINSFN